MSRTAVPPQTEFTLNLAGEGEFEDAIDVNNLISPRRNPDRWMHSGRFILGDIVALPIRPGCASTVIGTRLPMMTDEDRNAISSEAFCVLQQEGVVRMNSTSGAGELWTEPLRAAGFISGTIEANYLKAVKP